MTLSGAQRVLAAAIKSAEEAGLHVSIAVIGSDGQLKAFAAMDGTSILSTETARKKALTVIKVGRATDDFATDLRAEMAQEPGLIHGMSAMEGIAPFGGGVPIRQSGQLVGAVAVSGASSAEDNQIANAAASVIS